MFKHDSSINDSSTQLATERLWVAPSDIDLAGTEVELKGDKLLILRESELLGVIGG